MCVTDFTFPFLGRKRVSHQAGIFPFFMRKSLTTICDSQMVMMIVVIIIRVCEHHYRRRVCVILQISLVTIQAI